jgi:hypothetical protein
MTSAYPILASSPPSPVGLYFVEGGGFALTSPHVVGTPVFPVDNAVIDDECSDAQHFVRDIESPAAPMTPLRRRAYLLSLTSDILTPVVTRSVEPSSASPVFSPVQCTSRELHTSPDRVNSEASQSGSDTPFSTISSSSSNTPDIITPETIAKAPESSPAPSLSTKVPFMFVKFRSVPSESSPCSEDEQRLDSSVSGVKHFRRSYPLPRVLDSPIRHRAAPASGSTRNSLAITWFFWKKQVRCTSATTAWMRIVPDMTAGSLQNTYIQSATSELESLRRIHAVRFMHGMLIGLLFWWFQWRAYVFQFKGGSASSKLWEAFRCVTCATPPMVKGSLRFGMLASLNCRWHPRHLACALGCEEPLLPRLHCSRCKAQRLFLLYLFDGFVDPYAARKEEESSGHDFYENEDSSYDAIEDWGYADDVGGQDY